MFESEKLIENIFTLIKYWLRKQHVELERDIQMFLS